MFPGVVTADYNGLFRQQEYRFMRIAFRGKAIRILSEWVAERRGSFPVKVLGYFSGQFF